MQSSFQCNWQLYTANYTHLNSYLCWDHVVIMLSFRCVLKRQCPNLASRWPHCAIFVHLDVCPELGLLPFNFMPAHLTHIHVLLESSANVFPSHLHVTICFVNFTEVFVRGARAPGGLGGQWVWDPVCHYHTERNSKWPGFEPAADLWLHSAQLLCGRHHTLQTDCFGPT